MCADAATKLESALVVEVPAAEPVVSQWRRLYDPAATWGVPAHITILYPFIPPEYIDDGVRGRIRRVIATVAGFDFILDEVAQFGAEVLILKPKPTERFSSLIESVATEWPRYPPYAGIHDELIPHLTVARSGRGVSFEAIASRLSGRLPVQARADTVSLMAGSLEPHSWTTLTTFPLGSSRNPETSLKTPL